MRLPRLTAITLLAVVPAFVAGAQERGAPERESQRAVADSVVSIPRNMMPPAGKCRIWMKGVPAAQQPAPTDCTTALRQSPPNGVLVFGPALRDLSPFDVRNPFVESNGATRRNARADDTRRDARADDVRRNGEPQRGKTLPPATPGTQAVAPRREATVRATPSTRAMPAAREAPPPETRRPDPPPQSKKPEKP